MPNHLLAIDELYLLVVTQASYCQTVFTLFTVKASLMDFIRLALQILESKFKGYYSSNIKKPIKSSLTYTDFLGSPVLSKRAALSGPFELIKND